MVCNLGKGEGRESHVICFVGIIHNEICYRIAETFEVGRLLQYEISGYFDQSQVHMNIMK
jgi:hypothetical protein